MTLPRTPAPHTRLRGLALFVLPALLLAPPAARGQGDDSKLTLSRLFSSGDFAGGTFGGAKWLAKQGGYAMKEASEKNKGGQDIVRYDPETGKKEVLVSAANLVPPGGTSPLAIESFQFAPNEGLVLIFTNSKRVWRHNDLGDYWVYDVTSQKLHKLGGDAKPRSLQFAKFSPNSKLVSYVKDKDVFVEDPATGKINRLTERASSDIINGTFDWVYEEELDLRDGVRWSPDSKMIAFWQLDTSGVKEYSLINNTAQLYPKITSFKYPLVGETNAAAKVGVVPVEGQSNLQFLDVPGDPRNHYIARMDWAPQLGAGNQHAILIQQLNRLQNTNKVMLANVSYNPAGKGLPARLDVFKPTPILTEADKAWVDVYDTLDWFDHGKQFTWISERDGWRHVYAVSRDGEQQKLVTPGKFDVMEVVQVDDEGGWLYYYASPDNPTQKYLYRAKLDGSAQEKLTPADLKGTNTYDMSPDAKWAIHTYSNLNTPPVTRLIRLPEHKEVRVLAENKKLHENVKKLKIRPGEFFRVDNGGGVELDAWCLKPPDFDPAKKYPVLFYVYGEPAAQTVLDTWGGQKHLWHQMLAQEGYLVMSVDNRGTPAPRGREFRKVIYKQMGSITPFDQAGALRSILKKWSWVDPQRVAIWGWSGGGGSTLHALFRFPELYKTGMAVAAVTNERFYDSIYSERYMGLPGDNVKGYKECSPITYAGQLKGNLLIVHGTGDDNVHYANAEALINELIAQNKQFTMMAYPNRSHSISEGKGTRLHLFTLLTTYLRKNLPTGPTTAEKDKNGKAVGTAFLDQGEPKDKLRELAKARVVVATKVYQLTLQSYKMGARPLSDVTLAKVDLLKARLDACETKAERIKVYEDWVKEATVLVDLVEKGVKDGARPQVDALKAQALLLEAQFLLEKARLEK